MSEQIRTKSEGKYTLATVENLRLAGGYPKDVRRILGTASRIRKNGWYKSVTGFQRIGNEVIGPFYPPKDAGFQQLIKDLWAATHVS